MYGADIWINARARLARLGDTPPWDPPPLIPIADVDDIVLDRHGGFAVLVGYAGAHHVDLQTLRSQQIFSDSRAERRAGVSADGRTLFIFDEYGPTLHQIDLQTHAVASHGGAVKALRAQLKRRAAPRNKRVKGVRLIKGRPHVMDGELPLRPPHGQFRAVRAVARTPLGHLAVVGTCLTAPDADEPRLCLSLFTATGDLLGLLGLAQRGQDATHVYLNGQRADPQALAAKGIHISTDRSPAEQAAVDRFAPSHYDGVSEVVFGRLANGLFGRLDSDTALGDRAFGYEDPVRTRLGLCGQASATDDVHDLANDAALRWRFWQRLKSRKTARAAFDATAGLTDLLPEIESQLAEVDGQKARRQRLKRVTDRLRSQPPDAREAMFEAMIVRLRVDTALARVATLLAIKPKALRAELADTLPSVADIDAIHAACLGAPALRIEAGLALLHRAAPKLAHVDAITIEGALRDAAIDWLWQPWPALRRLTAPRLHLNDATLLRLAAATTLPRLEAIVLSPQTSPLAQAALHFSPRIPLTLPGDHPAQLPALLPHPALDPRLCAEIIQAHTPQNHPGLCLDGEHLTGVDLAAVIARLDAAPVITLLNTPVTAALVAALDARTVHLVGCQLDAPIGLALAARPHVPAWHFETCDMPPAPAVALHARLGEAGPRLHDPAADLRAFLTDATIEDALWTRTVDRLRAASPAPATLDAALDAALDALDGPAWRALVLRRPTLGALAAHPTACTTIAKLIEEQIEAGDPTAAPYGPFEVSGTPDGWSIAVLNAPAFEMANEPTFSAMRRLFSGQDVQTGDADFDALAHLSGDERAILGVMSAPTRAACTALLNAGGQVRAGVVHLKGAVPPDLPRILTALASWADATIDFEWLKRRFDTEPDPGVRARLLTAVLADPACVHGVRDAIFAQGARDGASAVREQIAKAAWTPDIALAALDPAVLAAVLPRLRGAQQLDAIARIGAHGDEHRGGHRAVRRTRSQRRHASGHRGHHRARRRAAHRRLERQRRGPGRAHHHLGIGVSRTMGGIIGGSLAGPAAGSGWRRLMPRSPGVCRCLAPSCHSGCTWPARSSAPRWRSLCRVGSGHGCL